MFNLMIAVLAFSAFLVGVIVMIIVTRNKIKLLEKRNSFITNCALGD
jgi:hypothetical protein